MLRDANLDFIAAVHTDLTEVATSSGVGRQLVSHVNKAVDDHGNYPIEI